MKVLFILGESGAGKTTLEKYLVEYYGFRTFQKYSSRPPRDDDSWYEYKTAHEITDMYISWEIQECIKFDGNIYGMKIPDDAKPTDCFAAVMVPSGYHQFIDMGIEDTNDVYSIYMTNKYCEEWMYNRGDSQKDVQSRVELNKKLNRFSGAFDVVDWSRWSDATIELLKLMYPKLFLWLEEK